MFKNKFIILALLMVLLCVVNAQVKKNIVRKIFKFKPNGNNNGKNAIYAAGGKLELDLAKQNSAAFSVPERALPGLSKNPNIEDIENDAKRYPSVQETPYGITTVGGSTVSGISFLNERKVCIVDSGYDLGHSDLPSVDVTGESSGKGKQNWYEDGCEHGTHVAGTIAALNNDIGVVGVAPSNKLKLHIVKVFSNSCGWTYGSTIINAINECVAAGANIISMSLGGPEDIPLENTAFQDAYNLDKILSIAAAGNDGNTAHSYPASYDSVMSVAATDINNNHASFSQVTNQVEISAPGVGVKSTTPGNTYQTWDGTSMATPHVSGVAALVWSQFPNESAAQIRSRLTSSAIDLGTPGRDNYFGYGLVQAKAAILCGTATYCSAPLSMDVDASCDCTCQLQCKPGETLNTDTCACECGTNPACTSNQQCTDGQCVCNNDLDCGTGALDQTTCECDCSNGGCYPTEGTGSAANPYELTKRSTVLNTNWVNRDTSTFCSTASNSIHLLFTVPCSTSDLTFSLCDSNYDTYIEVDGSTCIDDSCDLQSATAPMTANVNQEINLRVGGYGSSTGLAHIDINYQCDCSLACDSPKQPNGACDACECPSVSCTNGNTLNETTCECQCGGNEGCTDGNLCGTSNTCECNLQCSNDNTPNAACLECECGTNPACDGNYNCNSGSCECTLSCPGNKLPDDSCNTCECPQLTCSNSNTEKDDCTGCECGTNAACVGNFNCNGGSCVCSLTNDDCSNGNTLNPTTCECECGGSSGCDGNYNCNSGSCECNLQCTNFNIPNGICTVCECGDSTGCTGGDQCISGTCQTTQQCNNNICEPGESYFDGNVCNCVGAGKNLVCEVDCAMKLGGKNQYACIPNGAGTGCGCVDIKSGSCNKEGNTECRDNCDDNGAGASIIAPSISSTSAALVSGVVLMAVAVLAIAAAGVMIKRSRRTNTNLQHINVEMQQQPNTRPPADSTTENIGAIMNLYDNEILIENNVPAGWKMYEDDDTGVPYYVNESTGERSWELP